MAYSPPEMSFRNAKKIAQPQKANLNRNRRKYEEISQEGLSALQDSPLLGAWSDCSREFSVEERVKYHDDGLAHDDAIFPGSLRLLHLGWKSQLRDHSPKQGVCDQCSDRRLDRPGGWHRQHLGSRRRQVQKIQAHSSARFRSQRTLDRGVLRELRVPTGRLKTDLKVRRLYLGSGEGARGDFP